MSISVMAHYLVIGCVGCAVILWAFIGLMFLGTAVYNRISGKKILSNKKDVKVQDNPTNNDKSDLFLK